MVPSLPIGIALTLLAGLMSGNCMLPLKFNRHWKYENTWLVFSVVSLVILPWALALGLVDHIFQTYRSLSLFQIAVPFLFGIGWGIAQVLFGISVLRLGLGLAYAIIVGLGALLGTLVPLFVQHRSQVGETALIEILAGVAVMIAGIALSTRGGQIRERQTIETEGRGPKRFITPSNKYLGAVLLAILCGVMAPMLNFSFAFGQDIAHQAVVLGNTELRAAYAVWPIGLAGGLLPNIAYSLYLLQKNKPGLDYVGLVRHIVGNSHGCAVDGSLRALWHELHLSWFPWNLDRLGTIPDFHDHDRDAVGRRHR